MDDSYVVITEEDVKEIKDKDQKADISERVAVTPALDMEEPRLLIAESGLVPGTNRVNIRLNNSTNDRISGSPESKSKCRVRSKGGSRGRNRSSRGEERSC